MDFSDIIDHWERRRACCFSGHRELSAQTADRLAGAVWDAVSDMAAAGYKRFICGGAYGFDLLAGEAVLRAKLSRPSIELLLALPYPGYDSMWRDPRDRERLRLLAAQAANCIYVESRETSGCMMKRNRFMVDSSSALIAYCNRSKSGTGNTVKYAQKKGLRVTFIL